MNNHKEKKMEQINNDVYIRGKPRYFELKELFPTGEEQERGKKSGK
jgi:hypothetical protein